MITFPQQKHNTVLQDLTTAARRAYQRGIQSGNGGNLSARLPGEDRMIVSASGGSFADCSADGQGWVMTDYEANRLLESDISPSRESVLHGLIYKSYPDVMAVVHCHAPYTIAWANTADYLPFVSWQASMKLRYPVPIIPQNQPAVSAREWEMAAAALNEAPGLRCFIMRDHGVVAMGPTATEAEHLAEFVEECAQIAILKKMLSTPLFTGE